MMLLGFFLVIIIILLLVLIFMNLKVKNDDFGSRIEIVKELNSFKENAKDAIDNSMDSLTKKLEDKLKDNNNVSLEVVKNMSFFKEDIKKEIYNNVDTLVKKVDDNLKEGFKKSNDTVISVIERLSKIDEAQKNIDNLSRNVLNLQKVLTDKKLRGNFGEIQLSQILYNVFGDKGNLYDLQYKMKEGKTVDAVVFCKEPIGLLPIDSKFPLENFNRIQEGIDARKPFIDDVKKHINDISQKYVILQSLNQAIMFIPSEAVYLYILSSCPEIIDYSYKNKIWITSPTTLIAILTTIQLSIINIQKNENAKVLYENLKTLSPEFKRYKERWENLIKDFEKIAKDVKELKITSEKIGDKFEKIDNVQ